MTVAVPLLVEDGSCENDAVAARFERGERVLAGSLERGDYLTFSRRVVVEIQRSECGRYLRIVTRSGPTGEGAMFVHQFTPKTPVFVIRRRVVV